MMKTQLHDKNTEWTMIRPVCLSMVILGWAFLSVPVFSEWTPEQSKTADHVPGTPTDSRGWYPPTDSAPSTNSSDSTPAIPAPTPTHYDNNGGWTPEQSKTADHTPGTPSDSRGWYPPAPGSTDAAAEFAEKIATSNLANPLIQGGKAIGRTYEAADRGDMTGAAIEAADGIGRLSAIGLGATEGAAWGSTLGPVGTVIGGIVGGFLGNAGWNATGGAINESSRQMHEQQQQQARENAQQIRDVMPTRPASSGSGSGSCGGPCGR